MRIVLISALLLFACGGSEPSVEPDAAADCTQDSRAQTYTPGMAVAADNGVQVVLLSAAPAPPVRFENIWSLQILDAQDQPLEVSDISVEPFMPDHGHGTPQPPNPVAGATAGVFDMGPFDLWMPGIWELRISVSHGENTSLALLTFCIEE